MLQPIQKQDINVAQSHDPESDQYSTWAENKTL